MKPMVCALSLLLASSAAVAAEATPAPTFHPLAMTKRAGHGAAPTTQRAVRPEAVPSPVASETRVVPRADGSLDIRCREVVNPHRDADAHALEGSQR